MNDARPPRILVVEDDGDLRTLTTLMLDGLGDVTAVPDAYQALAAARDSMFDVIVVDLLMPGVTGLELVERMDALGIGAPFVVVTGIDRGPMIDRVWALGAVAVVVKPFTESVLRTAVAAAVAAARGAAQPNGSALTSAA